MIGKGTDVTVDTHPRSASPGRAIWLGAGLLLAGAILQWILNPGSPPASLAEALALASWSLLPVPFVVVGAVIVSRQPRNFIGWLLFLPPSAVLVDLVKGRVIGDDVGSVPEVTVGVLVVVWLASISWMALIFPVLHLLLVFPTGRVLTGWWHWLVRLELGMIGFLLITSVFARELGEGAATVSNPIGFIPDTFFGEVFNLVWTAGLLTLALAGAAALVVRYRRGDPAERQQLKWLLFAVSLFATTFSALALSPTSGESLDPIFDLAFALSIWVIPVTIGIAVLRYRLFEIDRLLSRTVTYLVVVGAAGLTYAGLVVGFRELLPVEGDLPVALSTLVVALAFLPLARRVQQAVDRRFFRSRYDAGMVMARVAEELRGSIDLEQVVTRARTVVSEVLAPANVSIWVSDAA